MARVVEVLSGVVAHAAGTTNEIQHTSKVRREVRRVELIKEAATFGAREDKWIIGGWSSFGAAIT
jgi:hypothetical protein